MVKAIEGEKALVAKAKQLQATGNVTSWELAETYAELRSCGWTVRKIANECEADSGTVSRFCMVLDYFQHTNNRPSFWTAYREVRKIASQRDREQKSAFRAAAVAGLGIADDIRHGDFREVLADVPDGSADLIFTDPPYAREFLPLFADLGEFAARVLCNGGSLITYFGQSMLPEVMMALTASGLTYRWLICVHHEYSRARIKMPRVFVTQKPLLWFSKGVPFQSDFVADFIRSERPDKDAHDWKQSTVEAEYLIDKLTPGRGMVIDPFAGSGTTLIAAKNLGRRFLGADIDETHCKNASRMLGEA